MSRRDEQAGRRQPPECRLIMQFRQAHGLSPEHCGRSLGITAGAWLKHERGWVKDGDKYVERKPQDDTLVRMASVVRAGPDDLERVGRLQAAVLMRQQQGLSPPVTLPALAPGNEGEALELLRIVRRVFGEEVFRRYAQELLAEPRGDAPIIPLEPRRKAR